MKINAEQQLIMSRADKEFILYFNCRCAKDLKTCNKINEKAKKYE